MMMSQNSLEIMAKPKKNNIRQKWNASQISLNGIFKENQKTNGVNESERQNELHAVIKTGNYQS